jgi:hypothetical protein
MPGRSSVAFGGRGMEPRSDPADAFNSAVRRQWAFMRGRIDADLGNW